MRGSLFSLLTPNAVFPIEYDPSVLDVQNALSATFPITLGVGNRFTDPNIKDIQVHHPPTDIGINTFQSITPTEFTTGGRFKEGDLVIETIGTGAIYYPVNQDFDPNNNDKSQYANLGMIEMGVIQPLVTGEYKAGDVISFPGTGELHIALTSFFYRESDNALILIEKNLISAAKEFKTLQGEIRYTDKETDQYDPDLIAYNQSDAKFTQYIYPEPAFVPENKRIGNPVFVARQNFFVESPSNTLGEAQSRDLVGRNTVSMLILEDGESYSTGSYVKTPSENEIAVDIISVDTCYLSNTEGLKEEYFIVEQDFSFALDQSNYTEKIEELIIAGFIKPTKVISFSECGRSPFKDKPFRYSTRFKLGEYLRYRELGGFSSVELESCLTESQASESCNALLSSQLPVPRYFQALKDFTPDTSDLTTLIESGKISEVEQLVFETTYEAQLTIYKPSYSYNITEVMIDSGIINSEADLENGDTLSLFSTEGDDRGVWRWTGGSWIQIMLKQTSYRDIFRLAPGDVVSFRQESTVKSYMAVKHFTPIFSPGVYIKNGTLTEAGLSTANRQWTDPTYNLEDFIYENKNGAVSFYRVIAPVTPEEETLIWNGLLESNTPRVEELKQKLLKVVVSSKCEDEIFSRLRDNASSIKLGVTNLTFRSKESLGSSDQFVWETTQYDSQTPSVSFSPTLTKWEYKPVDYGTGTLAL